jgi:hypothetical protein
VNAQVGFGAVVAIVWALSTVATFFDRTYHPPEAVNSVMMLVSGYFFAQGIRKPKNGDAEGEDGKP